MEDKVKSIRKVHSKVKKVAIDDTLEKYIDKEFTSDKDVLAEKHKVLAKAAVEKYRKTEQTAKSDK